MDDAAKPELLRRYLARWYWQVKGYVAGLTPESSDEQLRAAAPSIPVFALTRAAPRLIALTRACRTPEVLADLLGVWTAMTPPPGNRPRRC